MKVTDIHLYHRLGELEFSAVITIDAQFILQLSEDGEFSIPEGDVRNLAEQRRQDAARAEHDPEEVARKLRIPKTADELRAIGAEDMQF